MEPRVEEMDLVRLLNPAEASRVTVTAKKAAGPRETYRRRAPKMTEKKKENESHSVKYEVVSQLENAATGMYFKQLMHDDAVDAKTLRRQTAAVDIPREDRILKA